MEDDDIKICSKCGEVPATQGGILCHICQHKIQERMKDPYAWMSTAA